MSKQTLILIIILFFFTSGLLVLALKTSSNIPKKTSVQSVLPTPTINPYLPDTSLMFGNLQVIFDSDVATPASNVAVATPSATQASQNSNKYTIPIFIDTGENNVTIVQLELAFDPDVVTGISINPATFFENPGIFINHIDNKDGRISYALGIAPSSSESLSPAVPEKKGKGTLAIITFQSKEKFVINSANTATDAAQLLMLGESHITFLPKTFIVAEGIEASALKSTNSAELKFGI